MASRSLNTKRERAYRLAMHPLTEERKIGLITKAEFDKRHREIMQDICEQFPERKGNDDAKR